jgi:hypothetical protein
MNQKPEETTLRIEVTREGAEWSVRENGRTLIRFFGRTAAVELGCAFAKDRAPRKSSFVGATGASNARSGFGRVLARGDADVDVVLRRANRALPRRASCPTRGEAERG